MRVRRLVAIAAGACIGTLGPAPAFGQASVDTDAGQVRTQLTLTSRPVSVSYAPALRAGEPLYAALLSGEPGAGTDAVRVGRLEGHRSLGIGSRRPDPDDPPEAGPSYDLWLMRDAGGWALDARTAGGGDQVGAATSVRVPLEHVTSESVAETFAAGLIPSGASRGRILLRWGAHVWAADFDFVDLPAAPSTPPRSGAGPGSSLTRDSDTSARARAEALGLGQRDETALVTPAGARIQVLFHRALEADGPDYPAVASAEDGDVVQLTQGAAIRLRTEVSLQFGALSVPTGNLAPGFPGAYSLWLKRVGAEWRLVFNHEADVWGTQRDPAFDEGEISLAHTQTGDADRPLGVAIMPTGPDRGRLVIHWGPHEWGADFAY